MKTKRKGLLIISAIFLPLVLVTAFLLLPGFQAEQSKEHIYIELGSKISTSPEDYIECSNWGMPFTLVNTSNVNLKETGTYEATLYHGFQKFIYEVTVQDTTTPTLRGVSSLTIENGDSVSIDSLIYEVIDKNTIDSCLITNITSSMLNLSYESMDDYALEANYREGIGVNDETFTFTYGGVYEMTVTATDAAGNFAQHLISITVEEPPVIDVNNVFYVASNSIIDFSEYVTTWDFLDAEYSVEDIEIDTSQLNLSSPGEYTITFTGRDGYGLSTTKTSTVYVKNPSDLQELINTHVLIPGQDVIIGALNSYDNGYYPGESATFILEAVRPTLVYIFNTALTQFGSGYIIDISDEFVTIATNQHVVDSAMNPEIYFSDGTLRYGSVVAYTKRNDIAFVRIPINDSGSDASVTPEYVHENLRSVHINESYWENLNNNAGITICYNCLNKDGETWVNGIGTMIEKYCLRDWNQYHDVYETIISTSPVAGSSGSAIFDGQGRLIAMMRGFTTYSEDYVETVAIPLPIILDYYEGVFDEKVQYQ